MSLCSTALTISRACRRDNRVTSASACGYTYTGGQLSQMTVNGKNVTFSYDASGNPQTMTYDGVTYYYITNPMGDVTGIANESGTQLVFYYYTAYGTAYVSYNTAYQALGTTLSGVNPLFYRGYVYDRETGLYYLQSRYYNPEVGRFINADALVATGQGLLGNNMFAYCLNNPTLMSDGGGLASRVCFSNNIHHPMVPIRNGGGSTNYNGGISEAIARQQEQEQGSDPYADERRLLESDCLITIYRGVPVIKVPNVGENAFSFGCIFMGEEVRSPETLLHEYGHALHYQEIGIGNYWKYVALPSLYGYWIGPVGGDYYSQPWEYIADIFGSVGRTEQGLPYPYTISEDVAFLYWLFTLLS